MYIREKASKSNVSQYSIHEEFGSIRKQYWGEASHPNTKYPFIAKTTPSVYYFGGLN